MTELRISVAAILILMAGYVVVMNWGGGVIASERNKRKGIRKHHSTVPLISLILSAIAFELYPFTPKGWIGSFPAVDIGNWMLVIGLPWAIATGQFKKGPPNQASVTTSEPAPGADSSADQG
ncbi:MAG: hypothetical protein PHW08_05805 [Kiritimatiellae bacterium]|nr:hypothetical protein [Kiritimatiellia bacterium]